MGANRKVKTADLLATHPVFSLDEAVKELAPSGGRARAIERLKYHRETGRLKLVAREIYAVVPPGLSPEEFRPDLFLVASAVRPEGVFAYHSALELLGAAHSMWRACTLYTTLRRRPLTVDGAKVRFLEHPKALRWAQDQQLGTRKVERRGRLLRTTGPERTLVEGFHRPSLVGGPEELVRSASGFSTLDLDLLERVLNRYRAKNLWSAIGWFLERHQQAFHVPADFLNRCAQYRPRSPQYLERGNRQGTLVPRWNLILPKSLLQLSEPNEH